MALEQLYNEGIGLCVYTVHMLAFVCVCMYIYIYAVYVQRAYKYKSLVHTDRKGETMQVSVSCHRANKPKGVLSDAAVLLHKQTQM